MKCDRCGENFLRPGARDLRGQISQRGGTGSGQWLWARCWNCGAEMRFFEAGSPLNAQMQERKRLMEKNAYRAVRHRGHDLDRGNEAEEDREEAQRKAHGEELWRYE